MKKLSPKQSTLRDLQQIPGVGKSIAEDLWNLGVRQVSDLKDKNPEQLYEELMQLQGCHVDRCMLYVFRCAVYFASTKSPKPDLLLWWNWKDA